MRMYRLDKIDSHLEHVLSAIDHFGAAAGDDAGATLDRAWFFVLIYVLLFGHSAARQTLSVQIEDHTGTRCCHNPTHVHDIFLTHLYCSVSRSHGGNNTNSAKPWTVFSRYARRSFDHCYCVTMRQQCDANVIQMETMTADSPSAHLFENMAHTYSSMSNYPKVLMMLTAI
jgi:hypothetical protein